MLAGHKRRKYNLNANLYPNIPSSDVASASSSESRAIELGLKANDADSNMKESTFYIRQKLELGVMADRFDQQCIKYMIMFILIFYMYGAMCLKYVAGAESLY